MSEHPADLPTIPESLASIRASIERMLQVPGWHLYLSMDGIRDWQEDLHAIDLEIGDKLDDLEELGL